MKGSNLGQCFKEPHNISSTQHTCCLNQELLTQAQRASLDHYTEAFSIIKCPQGRVFTENVLVPHTTLLFTFWQRPFQSFTLFDESLKTFLRKNFGKMKVIVHLIENRTRKLYFSITKILFKKYCTYLAYMTVCFDFHQKDSGTLLFIFLK